MLLFVETFLFVVVSVSDFQKVYGPILYTLSAIYMLY